MKTKWENMLESITQEYKNSPTEFLRQPTISRTIHPNSNKLATHYFAEMQKNSFCTQYILPGLGDSKIGNPYQFKPIPGCSPMTIAKAYQLSLLKKHLGFFLPKEQVSYIVEVGGGYGHLCRMIRNFGYTGRYTIIDFPEMLEIQKNFLIQNFINNVDFCELNMEKVEPKENEISILIATFSVNEMPLETRYYIEPYYNQYNYLFFAHNSTFDGVDNKNYFSKLEEKLSPVFKIQYFRDMHRNPKAWFMICARKNNV